MRRFALPVLILATVIVAAALAWFTLTRGGGSGADVTKEGRPLDPFHRLEISGRADVTLVEGQSESVTVETAARGQPRVLARIENGTLMIDAGDSRRRWWNALIGRRAPATPPRISVAFKSLDAIALSGTVKLTADRISATDLRLAASGGSTVRLDDIDAQSIRIIGSGALKATLAGKVVEQKIEISGAGEIHADRLASQDAVVEVSGAGSIVVNVAKTLRATISGAGSVEYYGDPEVRQSISGVGRVKKRQSAALERPAVPGLAASLHRNV
jgi:hypothetical protein